MLRENNSHLVFELNQQKNTITVVFLKKEHIILCFVPISYAETVFICSHQFDLWFGGKFCFLESSASRVLLIRPSLRSLRGMEISWSELGACFSCDMHTHASTP